MSTKDTIVAIATPQGTGGIGIIRISGTNSLNICQKITRKQLIPRYATFCNLYHQDEIIDNGIVIFFNSPFSYTGEDVVEIQAHGNPFILNLIIKAAIYHGARIAKAGEFTERAFLNNKLDLAQAEAVADIINASSELAAKSAAKSLQGEFSREINNLLEKLIYLRMYVEASIDFPEEEINFLEDLKIHNNLEQIYKAILAVKSSCKQGVILSEGITIILVGKPNAGKSSLLNALAGKEAAIVTSIAGTTRDIVKEHIQINGVPMHIIDTAGLRSSDDIIESEGIKRAIKKIQEADQILFVTDDHINNKVKLSDIKEIIPEFYNQIPQDMDITYVHNKVDLLNKIPENTENHIYISAEKNIGINELKECILKKVGFISQNESIYTARERHVTAIDKAFEHINLAKEQLFLGNGELLAEELLIVQKYLNSITGEFSSDDLLGEIFSSFCIGK
ncbi:tRNA uridine-5-carboxymethylaminomethyl(34) synthesis GTPase MnmE [Allofrancisella guangzhouensis]|uniref:tRNA modification GTPase MnmE n=1 Tax=Allofrancisella guangzhouensis TaxID=594679 RepID=A0A0A8E9I9_9GAMM|nr:tRNA uridine-5-carboxymethylaminomethyl(34) synthesis GTPase MnmE [Allofrancisella guangzhouensis]AJC48841.1 tRNA modification GTPase TrmE [Allofrancisella guangzhouensis]MBK2027258.1 tRNA uridine-5-carboxymethylaminomethyl(34) synthesis GTPase MnmE [Allofrancisella guangzhouensis]MBK2044712.1 tRNA uridine-5-carboxymethylaminomethyl(34) synthesis GTPase MnmE [Allofrancisella guangzhouensis]MBK2045946.1 tRNA uridine-5-carboxymethylaminomethyl(34) synthesis GTPase MnmE [Allofrancisella guangzh